MADELKCFNEMSIQNHDYLIVMEICMLRYLFQPVFGICLELTPKEGLH